MVLKEDQRALHLCAFGAEALLYFEGSGGQHCHAGDRPLSVCACVLHEIYARVVSSCWLCHPAVASYVSTWLAVIVSGDFMAGTGIAPHARVLPLSLQRQGAQVDP